MSSLDECKMISWAHENTKASICKSYFIGQQPAGTDSWKCHGPMHFTLTVFHLDYNYLREKLHWSLYHPSIIQVLVEYSPSSRVLSTSLITTLPDDKRCHVMHSSPAPRVWCCQKYSGGWWDNLTPRTIWHLGQFDADHARRTIWHRGQFDT